MQNGAQWIEGNSPFKFQTNDLDPNSIVGSRFQILSRVLTNDFALLGDPTTITQEDSDNGTLSLFSTADELESIQDFAHNLEAQFSARLFDQAGNYAERQRTDEIGGNCRQADMKYIPARCDETF